MTDFASSPRTVQEALQWLAAVSPAVVVIPLGSRPYVAAGPWFDDEEVTRGLVRRLKAHVLAHRDASPIPDRESASLTFEITMVTPSVALACARPATPLLWLALKHRRERIAGLLRSAVRAPSDHGLPAPPPMRSGSGAPPMPGLAARPRRTSSAS